MEKVVYVVRHCQATGQAASSKLTDKGRKQAKELSHFFNDVHVDKIISSPFVRAQETIQPLAKSRSLPIQFDSRLGERILSTEHLPNWKEKLEATFLDPHLTFSGGESSAQATARIKRVVDELKKDTRTILVTHGNIMSLLLREYDEGFGYNEWKELSNPDVYELKIYEKDFSLKRIWQ